MKKLLFTIFLIISLPLMAAGGKNHHAALFLGATSGTYSEGHTYFTAGLEYEYLFLQTNPSIGIGLIAEMVMADHSETVLALPLIVHPYSGFKFFVAPAIIMYSETIPASSDPWNEEAVTNESDTEWFVRLGAGYDFHFNQFSVSPLLSVDFIAGHSYLVYGLSFGIGF